MSPLPNDDRRALLGLARRAIVEAVCGRPLPETLTSSPELARPAGAFVSLHRGKQLRGCIGQIEALESLAATVARCAVAASLEDPRFEPLLPEEVPQVEVEISVLSPHAPIRLEEIEVGKHGLLVTRARMRGLLLPQVATQFGWPAQRFLEETCRKAGLDPDAWTDPATKVEAFTAEVFSDADFALNQRAQAS